MTGPALAPAEVDAPAVRLEGISKRYGRRFANREVSLGIAPREVHAVIGENGAGKSTLMKILCGVVPPDAGSITVGAAPVARMTVGEARRLGIGMVHQHFMLVDDLSVAENVILGAEGGAVLDLPAARRAVAATAERAGLRIDPAARVADLSIGERQRVEIVKVLHRGARVLVLDEPTAVLTPPEVTELFAMLRELVSGGRTVVLVTHKLDEVLALANQVTVLRRGEVAWAGPVAGTTAVELARAMVGRDVSLARAEPPAPAAPTTPPVLAVTGLHVRRRDGAEAVRGVDLEVRPGEIVGIAGVEGNGQTELALAVAGLLPAEAGQVILDGEPITRRSARERRRRGLAHIPEDRQLRGLVLDLSVAENLALGREAHAGGRGPLLWRSAAARAADELVGRFDIRPPDPSLPARSLSGGNQQKVVVARALAERPRALVAAQPTRGVDVAAVESIWRALREARAAGTAILLLSSELSELRALADRILVMGRGRIVGATAGDADVTEIGRLMTSAAAPGTGG